MGLQSISSTGQAVTVDGTTAHLLGNTKNLRVASASGAQNIDIIDRPDNRDSDTLVIMGTSDTNYPVFRDTESGTNLALRAAQRPVKNGEVLELVWDQLNSIWRETSYAGGSGLLFGVGTSSAPQTTSVVDGKFLEMRCETTAASGDNRLAYLRYAIEGAGGGECLRAFTVVGANIGTAHGAHLSMSYAAEAGGSETSGLGAAVRGTTHIPDIASWAPTGTICSGMFELYSDGAASDPAGLTELSVLRLCNSGDATGAADVDTDAFLISVQGFTPAADTTKVLSSVSLAELPAGTVGLRVKIGSSTYYIPCVAVAEWN